MQQEATTSTEKKKFTLLVVSGNKTNYYEAFAPFKQLDDETELVIEQASFEDMSCTVYPDSFIVELSRPKKPFKGTSQEVDHARTIKPDLVLFRMISHSIHGIDYRNILYAFIYANIPCINSAHSVYCNLERPIVHAALKQIEARLGFEKFPLIPQTYYPDYREMNFTPEYPIVVKVGHVHAGYGKMKLDEHHTFEDLKSVMALSPYYVTAEHYYEPEYDLRIQKIGNHYRAFKKIAVGSWKSNTGACVVEDVPLTIEYKRWIDEASKIFGGLDICAIDAIHCAKDNKDYILEINDTAIGLAPHKEHEDNVILCEMVVARAKQILQERKNGSASVQKQEEEGKSTEEAAEMSVKFANVQNELLEAKSSLSESKADVEKLKAANLEMRQTLKQFNERHQQHVQMINQLNEEYEGSRVVRAVKKVLTYALVAGISIAAAHYLNKK